MIFEGIENKEKDEKYEYIVQNHLNRLLKEIVGYLISLSGTIDDNDSMIWDEQRSIEIRSEITPPMIKDDESKKDLIVSLLTKIYSLDYEYLTGEERYTIARSIMLGINFEEFAMSTLISNKDYDGLTLWLNKYHINETKDREYLLELEDKNKIMNQEINCLFFADEFYKSMILRYCDEVDLLHFEYPTSLFKMFETNELELLEKVQPEMQKGEASDAK